MEVVENTKTLSVIKKCGFDEIALGNQSQLEIENTLKLRESQLISLGLNIQRSYWKNGQRTLEIIKNNFETLLPQINFVLNELFPIYQWRLVEVATPGKTLLFELTLFEFSQHRARELGLEWPKRVPILALQGNLAQRGDGNSLITFADFGESQGVGKIIAQPQLRCKPGEKAIFQNGGELPITSTSAYQSKTEWKSYGLELQLEAAPDINVGAQEITISFSLNVSEPDMATALNGIPGLTSKKLQSRFDLRNDETTLLSTLLQKRESKNRSGLAFLTQIPILSYLFSNENRQAQQSELWIAIKSSWEEGKMKNPDSVKVNYDF
jgi:Flp pilus assembly secretin CpaC